MWHNAHRRILDARPLMFKFNLHFKKSEGLVFLQHRVIGRYDEIDSGEQKLKAIIYINRHREFIIAKDMKELVRKTSDAINNYQFRYMCWKEKQKAEE